MSVTQGSKNINNNIPPVVVFELCMFDLRRVYYKLHMLTHKNIYSVT